MPVTWRALTRARAASLGERSRRVLVIETGPTRAKALVTGGASGIGRAIVLGLEAEGVSRRGRRPLESDVGTVRIQASLGAPETSDRVVEEAAGQLGGLDLLVNCAAIARHEPITRISLEAWEATIGSNLAACVWTTARDGAPDDLGRTEARS